jgi:3',5'-cyclic AMP phosphodiesterase CpdA
MTLLAHLSDLHATPVRIGRPLDFASKRFFGWLSWRVHRGRIYRGEALDALVRDLAELAPQHVVVTGDLTNVACEEEFPQARAWLERLGGPERVSVVPGNHDAYVALPRERSWDLWSDYLRSDGVDVTEFPSVRVRGALALVGLSSAEPTPPFVASGRVGAAQLERLEKRLDELSDSHLCRVVLVHHPVMEGVVSARRALRDRAALRAVLVRTGADLVLHGHGHRTSFGEIPGPDGPIPVVGVRSASDASARSHKRAQYHVYEIRPRAAAGGKRFHITARIRGYDPGTGRFTAERERVVCG